MRIRDLVAYQRDELGLPDAEALLFRTGVDPVRRSMERAPVDSRGLLIARNRSGMSHVLNVVRSAAGVDFLDAQRGGLALTSDDVIEWIFLPMTSDIPAPDDAQRIDPSELDAPPDPRMENLRRFDPPRVEPLDDTDPDNASIDAGQTPATWSPAWSASGGVTFFASTAGYTPDGRPVPPVPRLAGSSTPARDLAGSQP